MANGDGWVLALAGESMVTRPFSMRDEPAFLSVAKLLRETDFTYAHLEMNFGSFNSGAWPAHGDSTGSFMLADPAIAHDLRWLGIHAVSLAQNHSLDFGHRGLVSTISACREAGLACAGTGLDLEDAREPTYIETRKGRVALISVASGNQPDEWAGLPKGTMPGRPGVNPLRVNTSYTVDRQAFSQLRSIGEKLGILKSVATAADENMPSGGQARFRLNAANGRPPRDHGVFVEGDEFSVTTQSHAGDLRGNLRSVKQAVTTADLVVVAHHFCVSEGPRGDVPPAFARNFARQCIDAGADIYVGHGWHRTLGIEIYHGKPLIYGIGNFFAQSEFVQRVPSDSYEAWGHDVDRLPTLNPADVPLHGGVSSPSDTWWSSAVIRLRMDGSVLREMTLHPVEMGMEVDLSGRATRWTGNGSRPRAEGRPLMADGVTAARILERIAKLSSSYGTEIRVEDGVGRVLGIEATA